MLWDPEARTNLAEIWGDLKTPRILTGYIDVNQTVIRTGLDLEAQPHRFAPQQKDLADWAAGVLSLCMRCVMLWEMTSCGTEASSPESPGWRLQVRVGGALSY